MSHDEIWSTIQPGGLYTVTGQRLSTPADRPVVRVRCSGPRAAMRPLRDAIAQIDRHTGQAAVLERTARRVRRGLRDHLLGERPDQGIVDIVSALNRLGGGAIVLEDVEHADPDTLSALRRITGRAGWLRPALVLCASAPPSDGDGAVLFALATAIDAGPPAPMPAAGWSAEGLPPGARRALRAAAVIGGGFEVEALAALLGASPLQTLEALQDAVDAGAPLADLGGGRMQLRRDVVPGLIAGMLPSLGQAYARRLATLMTPEPAPPVLDGELVDDEPEEIVAPFSSETVDVEAEVVGAAPRPLPPRAPSDDDVVDVEPIADDDYDDIVAPAAAAPRPPADAVEMRADLGAERAAAASAHLGAAGELEAAAVAWLEAARAADPLALLATLTHGQTLLALLEAPEHARPVRAAEVRAALGRLMLEGCAPEGCFRLDDALAQLDAAGQAAEAAGAPPALRAEILALSAMALYDRGEGRDLEAALDKLTGAIRLLMGAGAPLAAARLLNEQAAVWVRLGDPVRAAGLLKKSRAIFSEHSSSAEGARELAETYHLLARLPMHVAAREGASEAATSAALAHAHDARRIYERQGMGREAARVRETAGRLHLLRGDLRRAADALNAAMADQQSSGDAIGMARTTGALAELLIRARRPAEATELLAASVQLNFAKGSVLGLAHNRAVFGMLQALPAANPAAGELENMLHQAEQILTR